MPKQTRRVLRAPELPTAVPGVFWDGEQQDTAALKLWDSKCPHGGFASRSELLAADGRQILSTCSTNFGKKKTQSLVLLLPPAKKRRRRRRRVGGSPQDLPPRGGATLLFLLLLFFPFFPLFPLFQHPAPGEVEPLRWAAMTVSERRTCWGTDFNFLILPFPSFLASLGGGRVLRALRLGARS